MTKANRIKLIEDLETVRSSRVLAYVTGDRGVANAEIAEDVLRIAYDHARGLAGGTNTRLDLFLYSRGGDMMLPWPLVTTLRELFPTFNVLIPFKAHSAATFISLGANEIVMTPIAQLTPVEPTVKNPFTPTDPANANSRLGVNVEDVAAYFEFVRDRAEIHSDTGTAAALTELTRHVNPLALGNIHRFHKLASLQSKKLLGLHMDSAKEHVQINKITDNLVSKLFAHEYRIGRKEARDIGLKAVDASPDEEQAIWSLYEAYEASMNLRDPIIPSHGVFPPNGAVAQMTDVKLTYVESMVQTDVFLADFEFTRTPTQTPPGQPTRYGPQVQMTILKQGWAVE